MTAAPASPVTPQTRHFTASAAVFDIERRKVLLVHHLLYRRWQFPGGHVDPDESGAECAIREVQEETGLDIRLHTPDVIDLPYGAWQPPPFMVAEFPAPANSRGEPAHRHLDMLYVAVADSTLPLLAQEDEVAGARWQPVDGLTQVVVRADVPAVVPPMWTWLTGGDHVAP